MSDDYDGPTRERLGKGDLERATYRWVKEHDNSGLPYLVVSTLDRMLRKATITKVQHRAGGLFAADFIIARLDPLHAPDPARIPGQGWDDRVTNAVADASERNHKARKALGYPGSPTRSVCWHVLGCGESLKHWATMRGTDERRASGILEAALGVLVAHYRLGDRGR